MTPNWTEMEFDKVDRFTKVSSSICAALAQCMQLTKITFFARGGISAENLKRWGKAMSQVPHLEEIIFEHARNEVIQSILIPVVENCKHLKRIHAAVRHMSDYDLLESTTFPAFINTCMEASTLREISLQSSRISVDFTADQVELVAQLIRQSNLRKLSFRVGRRSTSLRSWALALRENETLQELEVRSSKEPGPVQFQEVSAFRNSLFEKNSTLKRLIVDDWTTDRWNLDALYNPFKLAAKKGLPEECTKHLAAIYFLLRLNNTGRDKIMAWEEAAPSSKKWLIATAANENDLSVVYFYLRRNPSVLNMQRSVLRTKQKREDSSSVVASKRPKPDQSPAEKRSIIEIPRPS